jgi:polar amino acid transport system ATP-binding protein
MGSSTKAPAHRFAAASVFHRFNLWPHMTALQNVIAAPPHVLGMQQAEADPWVGRCTPPR